MSSLKHILVAGGGPAGSLCAERLARAGFRVTLFEERRDWEKPCGGGVTWKTLARYPFLLDAAVEKKLVREAEFIAADGARARLALSRPLALYSRAAFNRFLLERARAAGARLVPTRVTAASTNGCIRADTTQGSFPGDFLVVATGARNALRLSGDGWRPAPRDLELTAGYYLPLEDDRLRLGFLDGFEGYLWSFPRADHLSAGICGKADQNTSAGLRARLDRFLEEENLPRDGAVFYSHLLPSLHRRSWKSLPLAGPGWARAGDAAGLVDPVTGEGIYYALRSGELLAEALIAGDPTGYRYRVERELARELRRAAAWQRTFYRGRWLGRSTPTRMVQALQRSRRAARLVDDLVAGTQTYSGLLRRMALLLAAWPAELRPR